MTIADGYMVAALALFLLAWWLRGLPRRPAILLFAALAALVAAIWDVFDDRWQAAVGVATAGLFLLVLLVNRLRKVRPRTTPPFISGPLLALPALAAVAALVMFPVFPLPRPSGPDAVGVREFDIVDASRTAVLAAGPSEPRKLLVRVWYPAGDVKGLKQRAYFTQAEAKATARTLGELVGFAPFFTYVKHVRTNSWVDAPLKAGARDLPVVIYSHGYTSFANQNTALFETLASHGYVVFSLQHTSDGSATVFADGSVEPTDPALVEWVKAGAEPPKSQQDALGGATPDVRLAGWLRSREEGLAKNDRIMRSGVIWLQDRLFLHDQLQAKAVPATIAPILAASRLDRVGEMGMSFGGATTGTVCMVDKRCAAGINLDGGDFPFQAFDAAMPVPFLMFHSDPANIYASMKLAPPARPRGFGEFSYEPLATSGSNPAIHRVWLKDTQHLGLSDFSLFVRRPVRDGLFGAAPPKVMIGAQNDYVLAFFDRYLRGQSNGFPAAPAKAWEGWVSPLDTREVATWWNAKPEAERAALKAKIETARRQPEGK